MAVITALSPTEAYPEFKQELAALRELVADERAEFSSVGAQIRDLFDFGKTMIAMKNRIAPLVVPGLTAVARDVEGDPSYDPGAEWDATQTAFTNLRDVFESGINSGATLVTAAGFSVTFTTFTPAQLSTIITAMDNLIATINPPS